MAPGEFTANGVGKPSGTDGIAMTDQDKATSGLATVIHLGAGSGARLADFQTMGAAKIVLLEPAAEAARSLARQTSGTPGLTMRQAVIGSSAGENTLNCWNLARLNSRRDPTALLKELFPGLRLKERQPVAVIPPAQLVEEIGGITRPALLVVQDPGSEMDLLQAWKADGLLDRIDRIELHAPEAALYDEGATSAELEAWLVDEGFAVTARDSDDPDWPILHLRADHAARALAHAETQKAELKKTITERDAALKAAEDKAARQETALVEARKAAEAQQAELEKVIAERDAALKAAEDKAARQETALVEARKAAEAQQAELKKAIAERDVAFKAAEARAKNVAELRDEIARLTDELLRSQFDVRRLTQDMGLSLRARDRLEADLHDLRSRHAQVLAVSQQQDALLRQLTPRLQRAAAELQALSVDEPHAAQLRRPGDDDDDTYPAGLDPDASGAQPKRATTRARKGRRT